MRGIRRLWLKACICYYEWQAGNSRRVIHRIQREVNAGDADFDELAYYSGEMIHYTTMADECREKLEEIS